MSLSKTINPQLSAGSAVEVTRKDWKNVDSDVKQQNKRTEISYKHKIKISIQFVVMIA